MNIFYIFLFINVFHFGFLRNPVRFPPVTPYPHSDMLTKLPTAAAADLATLYCIC